MSRIMGRKAGFLRGERLRQLREEFTEAQLIEKHDALVEEAANTGPSAVEEKMRYLQRAQVYADELARRESISQGKRMEKLTRSINILTIVILIATLLGVVLSTLSLLAG